MQDHIVMFNVSQFFAASSFVIGTCFVSICAAFAYFLLKRKGRFPGWTVVAICLFFLVAGLARLAKAFVIGPEDVPVKVLLDLTAAVLGVLIAILVWPMLIRVSKLPSRTELEEVNRDLMHSRQLFYGFMHNSPALQWVKDSELRFIYVNDAFCRAFNVKRDDILGKTNQTWMPSDVALQGHQSDMRVRETLQAHEEVVTFESLSGPRTWFTVKFPIWDAQFMIGGVGIDITEQREAEQREQRTAQIFELMVNAVKEYAMFMLDPDGIIETWNPAAERIKGYTAKEIIGKNFSVFYPREAIESKHPEYELERARQDGQYEEEGWRIRKDGSRFWAHVMITTVYAEDGTLRGFAKVTRDMTDRMRYEREMAIQRDKALEASAMKSRFVANISHEIRTPLSGILGMNELLLQTDLDEEQREYAETVQASSQSLLTVLNDVLDLSKVEAGKMDLDQMPFNVSFATEDATRLMSAAAKNKSLSLTLQIDTGIPDLVIGDPERFRQLLLNLIGNAVKFTHKGEVSVIAHLLSEDATKATIKFEVKDTGIGIAQEERKHVFVPFAQVDSSSTRKFGGTGLGLTICKHLVQRMHGEIGFESEKGKGSTFWFMIPFPKVTARAAELPAIRSEPTVPSQPTQPTVLIVEDNVILQDLVARQLANLGIKSTVATCGSDAIEAINGTQFDLILMDIQLPHVDGYEATVAIRKIEQTRNRRTPIVAMTAKIMRGDKEKALEVGMDDYVSKPVSLDTLRYLCEKWLARATEGDSARRNGAAQDSDQKDQQ